MSRCCLWILSRRTLPLARRGGFVNGDHFVFGSVEELGLRLVRLVDCHKTPAPVDEIVEALDDGLVVLVQVSACPSRVCQHWVRAVDYVVVGGERDLLIRDPLKQVAPTRLLPYYALPDWGLARAIYRVAFYERCEDGL